MLPSIFVGHGAPTIIWDENPFTDFLKRYGQTMIRPKGIIIFSAHWEAPMQSIGCAPQFEMIYDFYGFPQELYRVKYPAYGDASLAQKVLDLLAGQQIVGRLDPYRGIDHGAWTMLQLLYPQWDIPVVTMSVNPNLHPSEHYRIGASLGPLKEQDYLIICSGGIVHNLGQIKFGARVADPWAREFDQWIQEKIEAWDLKALFDYAHSAPHSRQAVPRSEHFLNLLIALGTGDVQRQARLLQSIIQYGNLSLDLWEFA
ncbi:MAG: class III extradiol ring-cleavage dioxygenase [Firmicutes bacterium]|nr:class III extradiol ring-cleavage dioxygenase [Bacillota bacterium]